MNAPERVMLYGIGTMVFAVGIPDGIISTIALAIGMVVFLLSAVSSAVVAEE